MIRSFGRTTLWVLLAIAGSITDTTGSGLTELNSVPDATFRELNGSVVTASDLKGTVVLINFWGTWCVLCLQEIPELVRLLHQFKKRGLEVVGIAVDSGRPEDIREFMTAHGMDYYILIGDLAIVKRVFRVVGFPTSLLVDRHRMIRKRYFGPQTGAVLKKDVESLL